VSERSCAVSGERFDANVTCGALCADFPACLPAPSLALITSIGAFSAQIQADHDGHAATARTLSELRDAITESLEQREEP
jgi:hypothetical protein